MLIIGGIEDNINSVIWSQISDRLFKITSNGGLSSFQPYQELLWNLTHPLSSNQPISSLVISVLLTIFKGYGYNLLFLITGALNLYFGYQFFKRYKEGWLYTLLFCFSTYFWSHIWNHLDLAQIWLIPWVFKELIDFHDNKKIKNILVASVKVIISVLISNYLGFGLIISLGLFLLFCLFTKEIDLKKLISIIAVPVIVLSIILFPYVKSNLINRKLDDAVPRVGFVSRQLGDFVIFSSRPWYYVVPFPKNLILGKLGSNVYDDLKKSNYYLFNDYFQGEHAANYFGLPLLLISLIVIIKQRKKGNKIELAILVSFFILSLPPFFTVHCAKIYLPSYLIFVVTPMFRVVARFSIIVLFLLLHLLAERVQFKNLKLKYIFIALLLLNLVDTFIPTKVVDVGKYSSAYDYLRTQTPEQSRFIAYPFSLTKDAYLHLPQHQRFLVNTRNYISDNFEGQPFNSEKFTNALLVDADKNILKKYNVKYFLVDKKYSAEIERTSGLTLSTLNDASNLILYEIKY